MSTLRRYINVVYERYAFNRRVQCVGETLDDFTADLQRLVRNCEYGEQTDRLICNLVYGVRDDASRRKLLLTVNLDLRTMASEMASEQQRDWQTRQHPLQGTRHQRHRNRRRLGSGTTAAEEYEVRAVAESGPTPLLTPTMAYRAAASATTSSAVMDIVGAASEVFASLETGQQIRDNNTLPSSQWRICR